MNRKLIEAVIYHAANQYEVDGWDILIECWTDETIWDVISQATSEEEAIRLAGRAVKFLHDHRMEIRNA
jgi:streptomycin 6-kinase